MKRKISKEVREQIDLEIDLLRLLSEEPHPNIIKVWDVFEDTQKIIIVMEFIEGGHMYQWVKDNQQAPETVVKVFFYQIC
jgi:NUAK family SNF1-like kinase